MAQDYELDRLRIERDRAFERKQEAWQRQDQAWQRRSAAREVMNAAFQRKQDAYDVQQAAWDELQRIRDRNGPQIEHLNAIQHDAYQNMKDAFESASVAYSSRDGAAAKDYSERGHRYKEESQAAVEERRILVQEIRDAAERHRATQPAFQQTKAEFEDARREHERAKSDHERDRKEFTDAKAEFERAKQAFDQRLAALRAENQRRKEEKRSLAERAGVPYQYLDDVWMSRQPDGTINFYFGGAGRPDGEGHGHIAMDPSGYAYYLRHPGEEHGAHNYADYLENQYHDGGKAAGLTFGGGGNFGYPIHATDEVGRPVTMAIGRPGTKAEGHTLITEGHVTSEEFYKRHPSGHEHFDGKGNQVPGRNKYRPID